MKSILLILSIFFASTSFGENWYSYCIADKDNVRYCSQPEIKSDDTTAKCRHFAQHIGSRHQAYEIQSGTDLSKLKEDMSKECDEIQDDSLGDMFACQYETLCRNDLPHAIAFANRVVAHNEEEAIAACTSSNQNKILDELKIQSKKNCYFRIVVSKIK